MYWEAPDSLKIKEGKMVEHFKFSINVKPRFSEEYLYSGVVDITRWTVTWCQEAYVAYGREMGIFPGPHYPSNISDPQWKIEIALQSGLLVVEEAKVYMRIKRLGRSSSDQEYLITEAKTERPIATVTMTRVHMDIETGRSVPWPDEIKQKIIAIEGKENVEVA